MATWRVRVRTPSGVHGAILEGESGATFSQLKEVVPDLGHYNQLFVDDTPVQDTDTLGESVPSQASLVSAVSSPRPILQPGSYLVASSGPAAGDHAPLQDGDH